jgi:hypothetical protein
MLIVLGDFHCDRAKGATGPSVRATIITVKFMKLRIPTIPILSAPRVRGAAAGSYHCCLAFGEQVRSAARGFTQTLKLALNAAVIVSALTAPIVEAADPLDAWTTANAGTENGLLAATFANGQFVAVGAAGTIVTSTDAVTWTPRISGTSSLLTGVAFGGGRFVAVGNDGTDAEGIILSSPDAMKWTVAETGAADVPGVVAYGGGRFVAVGIAHTPAGIAAGMLSSTDGLNWTPWKSPWADPVSGPPLLNGVAFGNGVFVAVFKGSHLAGPGSRAVISTDGVAWVEEPAPPSDVAAVTFGNGQFVGAGGYLQGEGPGVPPGYHAVIYTSADGTNWTRRLDATGSNGNEFTSVTIGAGQIVAGNQYGSYSSPDGNKWTGHLTWVPALGIAYGNGQFISVGGGPTVGRSGVIGQLGASLSPAGQLLGTITGVTGQKLAIETSTNLAGWTDLTSVTITNGLGQFSDPAATNLNRRFYRAMTVNP